jgi:hypothetical protein
MMKQIFEPMAQRINHLHGQVSAKQNGLFFCDYLSTSIFDFTIIGGIFSLIKHFKIIPKQPLATKKFLFSSRPVSTLPVGYDFTLP